MAGSLEGQSLMIAVAAGGLALAAFLVYHRRRPDQSSSSKKKAAGHAGNFQKDGFFYKLEVENRESMHACTTQ